MADKLYLTIIEAEFEGDTFFPPIDYKNWELTEKEVLDNDSQVTSFIDLKLYERKHK